MSLNASRALCYIYIHTHTPELCVFNLFPIGSSNDNDRFIFIPNTRSIDRSI